MLRKFLFLSVLVVCPSVNAVAQGAPNWEFFGGYSYLRVDLDPNLPPDFDADPEPDVSPGHINTNGWHASITEYANDLLGVTAEVSGHYRTICVSETTLATLACSKRSPGDAKLDTSWYSVAVGPQLAYGRTGPLSLFAHVLIGGIIAKVKEPTLNLKVSDSTWAITWGGGMDIRMSPEAAVRVQTDYVRGHFSDFAQNHVRISAGFVYRFGE